MCFSQEASLTVGTALAVIGIATVKKVGYCRRLAIAMMPLFFALQQFAEALVWHSIDTPEALSFIVGKWTFILYAWVFWPIWIPTAFLIQGETGRRRNVMLACLAIGLFIGLFDLRYLLINGIEATVVGNSIYYGKTHLDQEWLYNLAVMIPIFISTIPRMWIVGTVLLASSILSQIIWTYTYTSVWCFFAAVTSLVLYWVLPKKGD